MSIIEHRLPQETIDNIIEMFTVGCYSKSEIHRLTDISRPTIDKILADSLPGNLYILNKERDEFIVDCYKNNLSVSKTASEAKTTNSKVIAVLKHHSIIPKSGRKLINLIGSKADGWIQLTQGDYENRLNAQGNRCAICGKDFGYEKPNADHKHGVLKIRGFLCRRCNIGLAFVEDGEFMEKAIRYLEKSER